MPGNPRRQRTGPPTAVVLLLMFLALATVAASTTFLLRPSMSPAAFALDRDVPTVAPAPPPGDPRGLHLILVPHPDDEISAWTSLVEGADLLPVLVVLTQGEGTARCTADAMERHLRPDLGEIAPQPDPSHAGAGSAACREARLNSFREALDAAASHTPAVRLEWSSAREVDLAGHQARVVTGSAATLVELDLGDGGLTAQAVESVSQALLESDVLPDLPLTRVTSSAYYATEQSSPSPCDSLAVCPPGDTAYVYDHPDHLATREAARALAPLAQEGSWLVTHPYDPAVDRHLALPREVYDAFLGLGEGDPRDAQRLGSYQRIYGWLAFPDSWRPGDLPLASNQVIFPRVQSYEVVAP